MITVDMRDRKPIYEQLIDNIRTLAVQGHLKPDEQLPSVRQLAAKLAINPNTVGKAYAELERQGVICALPGRGNFISADIGALRAQEQTRHMEVLRQQLVTACTEGVSKEQVLALIDRVWEQVPTRKEKEE